EDKEILDFFKNNKCHYDFTTKKWTISKAYFKKFVEDSENKIFKLNLIKENLTTNDDEIKKLFPEKFTPYNYQINGIKFLLNNNLAILGDELGLGKTIQSLIALKYLYVKNSDLKAIIVVPLSLIESNWKPQFKQVFGKPITDFPNFNLVNYEKFRTNEKEKLLSKNY
ncbi:MAG: SNF2-related protein, partial [Thermoplasmata archaeon]